MADVNFSSLKYSIEIEQPITEINEFGMPVETWKVVRKTRAHIFSNYNSKIEKDNFDGTNFLERKEFTIRKLEGIKGSQCRIRYKGKKYNIILIDDLDEDGIYLRLLGQIER